MRLFGIRTFFISILFLSSLPFHLFAAPAGDPFQVSTYTAISGNGITVTTATGGNGDSIVLMYDTNSNATFMQRYNSAGIALQAEEWYLGPGNMSAAMDGQGNFIIVINAYDGSGDGVFATVYNRNANILVNTFRVNNLITGRQAVADVAMNRNGDFAILWNNFAPNSNYGVYTKRYQLNGTPLGNEVFVNDGGNDQHAMAIAMDQTGQFAIAMQRAYQNSLSTDIWGQRFTTSGNLAGSPFLVNTYRTSTQAGADIAMDAVGNFVFVWESWAQDGDGMGIYAQRFAANGSKLGGEFLVNTITSNSQEFASVAMAGDGSFVVTWEHNGSYVLPTILPEIRARQYNSSGVPLSADFKVSLATNKKEFFPSVSSDVCGNFIIGWASLDIYAGFGDAVARRYLAANPSSAACLISGQTNSNLAGLRSSWKHYKITVPAGKTSLNIQQWGPRYGDADLYVRYGAEPTLSQFNYRPYLTGNNETVTISFPTAGDWYIGINGYLDYDSVNLNATLY